MNTPQTERELPMSEVRAELQEPLNVLRKRLANDEESWRALCQIMPALTRPAAPDAVRGLVDSLRGHADAAYCSYIRKMGEDVCLGWEAKVKRGDFTTQNLNGFTSAAESLGRHKALNEAANKIESALAAPAVDGGEVCGCGRPGEYFDSIGRVSCNKYMRCKTPPADAEQRARELLAVEVGLTAETLADPEHLIQDEGVPVEAAIRAIAQALRERPAQVEPYAYMEPETFNACSTADFEEVAAKHPGDYDRWFKVYTTPPPAVDVAVLRELQSIRDEAKAAGYMVDTSVPLDLLDRILAQQPGVSR